MKICPNCGASIPDHTPYYTFNGEIFCSQECADESNQDEAYAFCETLSLLNMSPID
jgi:hypothetical protein